jgi:microfibrillar-associated protein 1
MKEKRQLQHKQEKEMNLDLKDQKNQEVFAKRNEEQEVDETIITRENIVKNDNASVDDDNDNDENTLSSKQYREKQEKIKAQDLEKREIIATRKNQKNQTDSSSSDSDDSSSSDSSSSSSSSSDSDEESSMNIQSSKPLFIPKHKRNDSSTQRNQHQKQQQDIFDQEQKLKAKRIQSSRALVAEVIATEKANSEKEALYNGGGDQNEFTESGGSTLPPPNDHDSMNEKDKMEQRDMWEVRELMRLLRDYEEYIEIQNDIKEKERRRNMTDEERFQEDLKSGKYRKPGEQRRQDDGVYSQRFHHRGAFYMDEDTLKDKNDIRHRAAEYANAVTGEDKVNRKALPKVMQVKKFGFAGQNKYQGLAKEDTTDKRVDYLPVNRSNKRSRGKS